MNARRNGFTLVELLISVAIGAIFAAAVYASFDLQQRSYGVQDSVVEMQENVRAAMDIMVRELRMAGYDPTDDAGAGLVVAAPDAIRFTLDIHDGLDNDLDGTIDEADEGDVGDGATNALHEDVAYSLFDVDADGDMDLRREDPYVVQTLWSGTPNPAQEIVAENIEALGFAYAFDADGDGELDTYNAGGNERIIWAFDSDGDNDLDMNLDTNGDGNIEANDGPGVGNTGAIPGQALVDFDGMAITDVGLQDIRAVRIWILARSSRGDSRYLNSHSYVVGNQVITPSNDGADNTENDDDRMRLLSTTVKFRNLGP